MSVPQIISDEMHLYFERYVNVPAPLISLLIIKKILLYTLPSPTQKFSLHMFHFPAHIHSQYYSHFIRYCMQTRIHRHFPHITQYASYPPCMPACLALPINDLTKFHTTHYSALFQILDAAA